MINLKPFIKINGDGSSLWGQSRGEYTITKIEIDGNLLNVYGKNTDWFQYTDNKIEKEVEKNLIPIVEKHTGKEVRTIGWSEQGMQPDKGWNFDITFYKRRSDVRQIAN